MKQLVLALLTLLSSQAAERIKVSELTTTATLTTNSYLIVSVLGASASNTYKVPIETLIHAGITNSSTLVWAIENGKMVGTVTNLSPGVPNTVINTGTPSQYTFYKYNDVTGTNATPSNIGTDTNGQSLYVPALVFSSNTWVTATNFLVDCSSGSGRRDINIVMTNNSRWYLTNFVANNTNMPYQIVFNITNSTASALLLTNETDVLIPIGNHGIIYTGINTIYLDYNGFGYTIKQDTSLIPQSLVEGLEAALADLVETVNNRAPAFETLTQETPDITSADHALRWRDLINNIDKYDTMDNIFGQIAASGSFSYDIDVTGETETNVTTSIYTNSPPLNTTREYHATVGGAGKTNFYRYAIEAIAHNDGGVVTIMTNQLSVKESAVTTGSETADATFALSGSSVLINVLGPTNGENIAWWSKGFYTDRTNHVADAFVDPYVHPLSVSTSTVLAAYSITRSLKTNYAGSLIAVYRSSDGATNTFGLLGNELDYASLVSWVNAAGTATGLVTRVYDQSGNNHHLGSATDIRWPMIVDGSGNLITGANGKPVAKFYRTDNALSVSVGGGSGAISSSLPVSYFTVIRNNTFVSGQDLITGGSTARLVLEQGTGPNKMRINSGATLSSADTLLDSDYYTVRAMFTSTTTDSVKVNDNAETNGSAGNSDLTNLTIGSSTAGALFEFHELIVYTKAISESEGDDDSVRVNMQEFYLHH